MIDNNLLQMAAANQEKGWHIVEKTGILSSWSSIGATVNPVGSLKMGLIAKKLDVDFHVYTDPFVLSDSFKAMTKIAETEGIRTISYTNLLQAEDRCIEWHACYEDPGGDTWKMDIIHILKDSPFAGYFEKVADRISSVLDDETRTAILAIKNAIPMDEHIMGIEIYRAVIEGGVRCEKEFRVWRENNPQNGIISWMP